jgi:hypothetical protein
MPARPDLSARVRAGVRKPPRKEPAGRWGGHLPSMTVFLEELEGAGCDLYLHQQALDTTTPAGCAMFQMLGGFSEFERSIIRSRVKGGHGSGASARHQERQADWASAAAAAQGRADPRRASEGDWHHQDRAAVRDRVSAVQRIKALMNPAA